MRNGNIMARPGQLLEDHLFGVGAKAKIFASKIGLADCGELIGLLHDVGKYSLQFQEYLYMSSEKLNSDFDNEVIDQKNMKGKIDHSTAGAQWVWQELKKYGSNGAGKLCGQILALCVASHHSGLIDCLSPDGATPFAKRMMKPDFETNYKECFEKIDKELFKKINELTDKSLIYSMGVILKSLSMGQDGQRIGNKIENFYIGMLIKFLFSCLIDADRIDSAFPNEIYKPWVVDWTIAIERLEKKIKNFPIKTAIDPIRRRISDDCFSKAAGKQGIYTLTVPTGGGKTLASLRYALHHAYQHKLDHIIYIIPYTSIIEQNAQAIQRIIEDELDETPWVLEHHSNLEPEMQTWHSKLASENWDSPIILTTMVQFLEVLFGGGTRGVRRLHQLANSVLIFDEIQTIPIKCIHLFCNALNFLVNHTKTTAVLCTATQPLLNELKSPEKGQLFIPDENELVINVKQQFEALERVEIINQCRPDADGWKAEEIVDLAINDLNEKGNCLVIVNTKEWAQKLYKDCEKNLPKDCIFHLSTNLYPAHRKKVLEIVKVRLQQKLPVLCISTQVIEAGVDIDFAVVIRFRAGLDSIAQAAGRCNRNGELKDKYGNPIKGIVRIINPDHESIDTLKEIKIGKDTTLRIFDEFHDCDLLSPEKIKRYFEYYYNKNELAKKMTYNVSSEKLKHGHNTTLLDLLSDNLSNSVESNFSPLSHSFMTAGKLFEVIDMPTKPIIIQHGDGKNLVSELSRVAKDFNRKEYYDLLKKAQRFCVNVYPHVFMKLQNEQAVYEIQDEGIYYLDERYYSEQFGLSTEPVGVLSVALVD